MPPASEVPTPDLSAAAEEFLMRYGGWEAFCRYYALNPFIREEYRDAVQMLAIVMDRNTA
ncbi:uncharacterized protein LOC62_01G000089 [Vanrija pseudolonga]|uniref:Uncharacterized protein n=1 Tax=Vanrija pseudolonga TaxID=143232 RepID=A0AAF1BM98_9TREE|nr:hypothetical protein LOC62_01G000089 [Vanrija pseudolonga]